MPSRVEHGSAAQNFFDKGQKGQYGQIKMPSRVEHLRAAKNYFDKGQKASMDE